MKTENTASRSILRVALATALILSLPLVAMLFIDGVNWGPGDFGIVGALVAGTGLLYELVARKAGSLAYRIAAGVALVAALLLVWISASVGIIGSDGYAANWMYAGVIAVGIAGSLAARFRSRGMARTLLAVALAQALVTAVALAFRLGAPASGALEILALNGFFVALWAGSATLFREAARAGARPGAA